MTDLEKVQQQVNPQTTPGEEKESVKNPDENKKFPVVFKGQK